MEFEQFAPLKSLLWNENLSRLISNACNLAEINEIIFWLQYTVAVILAYGAECICNKL